MHTKNYPPGVVGPVPLWALSSEHNEVERARRRHARTARETAARIVSKHPKPYLDDPVTASALSLGRLAASKGLDMLITATLEACVVEGRVPGERRGFTATWLRGRAQSALWFEPEWKFGMVLDERPASDATVERNVKGKVVKRAHPRRMPRGLDRHHAAILASPYGVTLGFAELTARVKALG